MEALLTKFKALSDRLDRHLKNHSKGDNELFYAAEADKLHMQQEVEALKREITRCTKDLMEGLDKLGKRIREFQRRACEDLDTSLGKYNQVVHGALVGNELLDRAKATGFKQLLDGYRGIMEELSAAVISCEKVTENELQSTYDNLSNSIEAKIGANPPSDVSNYVTRPSLITNPHYSLDMKKAKNDDGPLLKPLLDAKEVISNAIIHANEPITSVSLSLEKLPEKPIPDVLQWLEMEHPNILGLHFGDVSVNRTTPALFVTDVTKVNVYTLVNQIGTNPLLVAIKPESEDCRGGLLPVFNSRYILVSEAQLYPTRKKYTVALYKWVLENDKPKAEFANRFFFLNEKTREEVNADGLAWLIPKRLEERTATFYAALAGSSELHEILLSDNTFPPQFGYRGSNEGHHKLDGKLQSLGYRCTNDSGENAKVRIVASFINDDAMYVYDSGGDTCAASIERKIKIERPQWLSEGAKWKPFNPLPLGDELVLLYNKPMNHKTKSTVHALRTKRNGEIEWIFENVDATDVKQMEVDLKLADWCLAHLPTINPAAVLLVANDTSRKLEFYQLVLHLKALNLTQ